MDALTAALEQQRKLDGVETGLALAEGAEFPPNSDITNADAFDVLVELLKAREELEAKREKQPTAPRSNDFYFSSFYQDTQAYNLQQRCSHRKGGKQKGTPLWQSDFNVSMHTFPTGETRIRCLSCGWNVWNRPGWSYKWAMGIHMVNNSSNSASASQAVLRPGAYPVQGFAGKITAIVYDDLSKWAPTTYDPDVPGQPDNPIRGFSQRQIDRMLGKS
jgi:hypothetical protein